MGLGKTIQGKEQAVIIMPAYRPCKPLSSGVQKVYEQHARTLSIICDPTSQLLSDLKDCIQERQKQGDLIIIWMNLNNPVQWYNHTKRLGKLHMKETILTTYIGTPPLATNILNESNYPIGCIWCSLGLTALRAGYSKFKADIPSDHRVL